MSTRNDIMETLYKDQALLAAKSVVSALEAISGELGVKIETIDSEIRSWKRRRGILGLIDDLRLQMRRRSLKALQEEKFSVDEKLQLLSGSVEAWNQLLKEITLKEIRTERLRILNNCENILRCKLGRQDDYDDYLHPRLYIEETRLLDDGYGLVCTRYSDTIAASQWSRREGRRGRVIYTWHLLDLDRQIKLCELLEDEIEDPQFEKQLPNRISKLNGYYYFP